MEKLDKKDQHRDLRLAMKIGELLTINGSEIRRVENTMERILLTNEDNRPDCNCTPGSVGATVTYPDGGSKTMILRIHSRHTDFKKIIRINELSRNYTGHLITYEEAIAEIEKIENMKIPPLYLRSLLNALSCACFTFLFTPTTGNVLAALISGFVGMMIYEKIFQKIELSTFIQTIIASAILTILAFTLCAVNIGTSVNYILLGITTPLLPGVETINAVRDIVENDHLSAVSRIFNAILWGSAIAVGVGSVYLVVKLLGGI